MAVPKNYYLTDVFLLLTFTKWRWDIKMNNKQKETKMDVCLKHCTQLQYIDAIHWFKIKVYYNVALVTW
jgi:hypothetical protein